MSVQGVSEAARTLLLVALSVGAAFSWHALRTAAIPVNSPERLVAELRLAQIAALLLTGVASAYAGLAAGQEHMQGSGLQVALALGFALVAGWTLAQDPRQALTVLALCFAAHAVLDVAHRPGLFPDGLPPRWYALGCAVFNLFIGAMAYLPILRR